MNALEQENREYLSLGDKVKFYCRTNMCSRIGIITALDVEVKHQWHYKSDCGRTMVSNRDGKPRPDAYHPTGVEVNGSLTFSYSEAPQKV